MVSYKVAWNVKMRDLLCVLKINKQRCMECENERFIVYVDRMKVVFKKKWLKKKKIKKKERKGAEVAVVPSITIAGERSWIEGLIRD